MFGRLSPIDKQESEDIGIGRNDCSINFRLLLLLESRILLVKYKVI